MAYKSCIVVLALISVVVNPGTANRTATSADIDRVLNDKNLYDKYLPPRKYDVTNIYIGFFVNNMALNYDHATLEINAYMRMAWNDPRLKKIFEGTNSNKNTRLRLFREHTEHMWMPDLFIRNSHQVERVDGLVPEMLMTVSPAGNVWYVPRLVKTLYCNDLRLGMRRTTCTVEFESYGYTSYNLKLAWLRSPIGMAKSVTLDGHSLQGHTLKDCSQNFSTGAYPCLEVAFQLIRDPPRRVFEVGIYITGILLIIVSWLGFWTPPGDRRVFLGLTVAVVLAVLYLSVTVYRQYAYIEIVTSAQTWLVFCLVMDLGMVLEYAFAHVLIRIIPKTVTSLCCKCTTPEISHFRLVDEEYLKGSTTADAETPAEYPSTMVKIGYTIDIVSGLLVFPAVFIIFLVSFAATSLPFV